MNKEFTYIYNDNIIDLLSLIYYLYKEKIIPINIKNTSYSPNLFDKIKNNTYIDNKIIDKIKTHLGRNILNTLYRLYYSNEPDKELLMYYFFIYVVKYKNKVYYLRNNKIINKCLNIDNYVNREIHKFKGFTRFKELKNNVFYAKINPTNNILIFLINHFKERFKNESFIILDTNHNIYGIYHLNKVYFTDTFNFKLYDLEFNNNEKLIEELWISFYKTIAIKERKNERCRMNFMPKKYWKYIIEMEDVNEKDN